MRFLVLALALAMPLVGWLSNSGQFGPTNGEISDRYPTLIVAAGYAFAIWGPIFLLDVVFGVRQALVRDATSRLHRIRVLTAAGAVGSRRGRATVPNPLSGLHCGAEVPDA